MKKFLFHIFKIITIILLLAVVLDCIYTYFYLHTNKRNKFVYVYNSGQRKYDVIFLGSSRANNHFDPKIFQEKGLKAFNYGVSGACLEESCLLLKLMIKKKYSIKNIVLEVDLNINSNSYSDGTRARFMPYLHNSNIINEYYSTIDNYKSLYYIPFYRYTKYDAKIGFREMFFSAIDKKSTDIEDFGFYKLTNQGRNMSSDLNKYKPKRNISYEEIKLICKENNIKLIAITTPICKNTLNLDYFKQVTKLYPEIYNYENSIKKDKYFSSCGHMNVAGAQLFTSIILNDFFIK